MSPRQTSPRLSAKSRRGRPPEGNRPMTDAERAKRYRARCRRLDKEVVQFDRKVFLWGPKPLTEAERRQKRDALQKIKAYRAEIARLTAANERLRAELGLSQEPVSS